MATREDKIKEKREQAISRSKGVTGEPLVTQANYIAEISNALAYYNKHESDINKRKWLAAYLKDNNHTEELKLLKDAPDHLVSQIGVLCRLLQRGQYVSEEHQKTILSKFTDIRKYIEQKEAEEKLKEDKPKIDKNAIVARQHLGEIAGELDKFTNDRIVFDVVSYIAKHQLSVPVVKKISEFYVNHLDELKQVATDEQLQEGYSYLSNKEFKTYYSMIESIVNAGKQLSVAKKVRTAKVRPAQYYVRKLKFLKENTEYGLKSISPVEILGAKELWVFNTKNRMLMKYVSDKGLEVKGSGLLGYDVKLTTGRRLRKPEEFFKVPLTKTDLNKAFKTLTTIEVPPNGRINSEMIILKAFK